MGRFEIGDLVWAKMKGYPSWPARIIEPTENAPRAPKQKKVHFVYFFGTRDHAWIVEENILPHSENMLQGARKKKTISFQNAVKEIMAFKNSLENNEESVQIHERVDGCEMDLKEPLVVVEECVTQPSKPPIYNEVNNSTQSSHDNMGKSFYQKRKACDSVHFLNQKRENKSEAKKRKSNRGCIVPVSKTPLYKAGSTHGSSVPRFNVHSVSDFVKEREIKATTKAIGFIGLGIMGRNIVKNLIHSGHKVVIYNRSPEKCNPFRKICVSIAKTPADVVKACDIIFSCLADKDAVTDVIRGKDGVLEGLKMASQNKEIPSKIYVEMTTLTAELSALFAADVSIRNAHYIEAPLYGTRQQAVDGTLVVIVAGDKFEFLKCETCFCAIAETIFFVSTEVGTASKMNIVLTTLKASLCASVAETLALLHAFKPEIKESFNECIEEGPFNCIAIQDCINAIMDNNFGASVPLKHVSEILSSSMMLNGNSRVSSPVATATSEMFKRARINNYAKFDAISVYKAIKH